jgi:hypothetical protein
MDVDERDRRLGAGGRIGPDDLLLGVRPKIGNVGLGAGKVRDRVVADRRRVEGRREAEAPAFVVMMRMTLRKSIFLPLWSVSWP